MTKIEVSCLGALALLFTIAEISNELGVQAEATPGAPLKLIPKEHPCHPITTASSTSVLLEFSNPFENLELDVINFTVTRDKFKGFTHNCSSQRLMTAQEGECEIVDGIVARSFCMSSHSQQMQNEASLFVQ
jgi:hypothetical protein